MSGQTLRRSEFDEWTLYQVANQRFPQYLRLSSVYTFGDKVAVSFKELWDTAVIVVPGKPFPEGAYNEDTVTIDCNKQLLGLGERTVFNAAGEVLYHYKWADPEFLDLSIIGTKLPPGSVAIAAQNILCHEELRTPLLGKRQLASMTFSSLSSTADGEGDMFYVPIASGTHATSPKERIVVVKQHHDHKIEFPNVSIADLPSFRTIVERAQVRCADHNVAIPKSEYYDASNNLVYLVAIPSKDIQWMSVNETSPLGLLSRIVCNANEVQK